MIPSISEIFWSLYIKKYLKDLEERFQYKIIGVIPNKKGCLEWPRNLTNRGYGQICDMNHNMILAHRASIMIREQKILQDEECILHKDFCHNRACFNSEHLYHGNKKDNAKDRRINNTCPIGEKSGMALISDEQTLELVRLKLKEKWPNWKLSYKFNLAKSTISSIMTGYRRNQITNIKQFHSLIVRE